MRIRGHVLGYHRCLQFPGILSLVDLRLVIFGLVTCQVGIHARKRYRYQRPHAIGPLELTEEVRRVACAIFAGVNTRMLIDLSRQYAIVPADLGITLVQALELEDLFRTWAANPGVDVYIQDGAGAIITY